MSLPLLQTKLYVPPPRSQLVPRTQLLTWLHDQGTRSLTLVSAPAGFGKTTLVTAWLYALQHDANATAGLVNPGVAWLSLDEDDNDPTRFLTYVIAALQSCAAQVGESALALLATAQPPLPKVILTQVLNDLNGLAGALVLVLDDYHFITTPALHEALTFLIDHLPPTLRLIITTRADSHCLYHAGARGDSCSKYAPPICALRLLRPRLFSMN